MFLKRKQTLSWLIFSLIAILILAACTSTGGNEPTADDSANAVTEAEAVSETAAPTQTTAPPATAVPTQTDAPTATAAPAIESEEEIMTEDNRPDRLRTLTASWDTNWNKRIIEYDEILSGGPPRDGIPSIDNPQFIPPEEAAGWLAGNEPVIALEINNDARAYPLQILTWHEIVNDTVGGEPVVVTFCPLCNAAITFKRTLDGEVYEFGTSGLLRNSDLIMYDRTTETLWQQFTGEAIVGDLVSEQLEFVGTSLISFADFREAYPQGVVLSRDTGFNRDYGRNPYVGYDNVNSNPFLFTGVVDGRLPAMARVVTVSFDNVDVAYPLDILADAGTINDSPAGHDLVVFHKAGTSSALGAETIADAKDVGATGVFDPNLNGQNLTFVKEGDRILDEQTESTWNIVGQAIDGPLAGEQLTSIVHANHFWFSWAAFKPDTIIYQPGA